MAGQQVRLGPIRPRFYPQPRIDDAFRVETDAEGRFVFKRVPPVKSTLMADLSVWRESPLRSSESVPLDLQPGQTVTIDLNGEGTEVTGRVVLKGQPRDKIDLNYSLNYLVARRNGIRPPRAVAEKGFDWRDGWSDAWSSSLEGQAYKSTLHHYFVKLNRDGTFRISGVPPGEYELALKLYEPPEDGCLVQPVATRQLRFKVPDGDSKPTLDLGKMEVEAVLGPRPGDVVPDFTFETLRGEKKSLQDFRGRYVLIDVWATWCAPCVTSLPMMRDVHKQLADNDRIVVLGLNLDSDREQARQYYDQLVKEISDKPEIGTWSISASR